MKIKKDNNGELVFYINGIRVYNEDIMIGAIICYTIAQTILKTEEREEK